MIAFLKLIRYKNLLMVALTLFLTKYAFIISWFDIIERESYLTTLDFILLTLSVLFITAGGYIVNDILDIKADRINKPTRAQTLVSISIKRAWVFYVALTSLGLILGIFLSFHKHLEDHSFYFIGSALLLFFYSKYFKRLPLLGNLLVASLCTLTIYLVYTFDLRMDFSDKSISFKPDVYKISLISIAKYFLLTTCFVTSFIREVIKDMEDINGDYNMKMRTLPIVLGVIRARNLVVIPISILFFFYVFLISYVIYGLNFLLISTYYGGISALQLYFIYKLWSAKTKKEFHYLSNLMKLIMFLGILSMGLFKFI